MGCVHTKYQPRRSTNRKLPKVEVNDIRMTSYPKISHCTYTPPKLPPIGSWQNIPRTPKRSWDGFTPRFTEPGRKSSLSCRSMLTPDDKQILQKHWIATVLSQEPEFFVKVMVESMKQCPKIFDVVSCNMGPCAEQINSEVLARWPKLRKIAKGNCHFFTRQIVLNKLEDSVMRREAEILGPVHLQYARFGFESQFLDVWQTQAATLIEELEFPSDVDKILFVKAFKTLCTFICTLMVMEMEDSYQSMLYLEETIKTMNC